MKLLTLSLSLLLLTGCMGTLVPKRVEFFQDKVEAFPEKTYREKEVQRQAAARLAEKTEETWVNSWSNHCVPEVTGPAEEAKDLAKSVSASLGPPARPSLDPSKELAAKLDASIAKLNARIDDFKKDNNENTGKKIEGTGLFQVPYFLWVGLVGVFLFVGMIILGVLWTFLKMYALSNPPVALGVNAIQTGAGFAKRALSEVLEGGEAFKKAILKEVSDPALQEKIKNLFRVEHKQAQSRDTQDLIKELTK